MLLQMVQHVQLGDDQAVEAVEHGGVAQQRHVEPAAAPRTSGDRAELVADLAERLAGVRPSASVGNGPRADARDVGLGDSHDAVDARGRDARARAGAAGASRWTT